MAPKTSPIKFEGNSKKEQTGSVIVHFESHQGISSQQIKFEHAVHNIAGKIDAMLV